MWLPPNVYRRVGKLAVCRNACSTVVPEEGRNHERVFRKHTTRLITRSGKLFPRLRWFSYLEAPRQPHRGRARQVVSAAPEARQDQGVGGGTHGIAGNDGRTSGEVEVAHRDGAPGSWRVPAPGMIGGRAARQRWWAGSTAAPGGGRANHSRARRGRGCAALTQSCRAGQSQGLVAGRAIGGCADRRAIFSARDGRRSRRPPP